MRIRDAQGLIFGSLSLLMLIVIGSFLFLTLSIKRQNTLQIPPASERARVASAWALEIPGEEIWGDAESLEFTREIDNYTLSGTFQTYEAEGDSVHELPAASSLALVDDLRSNKQHLLRQGDTLGPFSVEHVAMNQITLKRGDQNFVLALSGEMATAPVQKEEPRVDAPVRFEDLPALETTRFGKKVGENKWVIDREEVFGYAEEIMGDPVRAIQLYRSFDQQAKKDGDVPGFKIKMKGEQDFFSDMGLGDGDIIRKVNSMEMKTQVRAEYLVREFMKSRMSAVVLDVENDGETRQQIFIVR
ncbi:hypothetical protein P0Y35_09370 [Kiritimatiellaeota bacterium B1221]|nr:hypothetical protein [Kiritimatiellaeota bacterium B1221]